MLGRCIYIVMLIVLLLQQARAAAAAVCPDVMFRDQTDKFSKFDEQGLPTHDVDGLVISDSQRKKLCKQWQAQDKKYKLYLEKHPHD